MKSHYLIIIGFALAILCSLMAFIFQEHMFMIPALIGIILEIIALFLVLKEN